MKTIDVMAAVTMISAAACAPTEEYECVCVVNFAPDSRHTIEASSEEEAQAECDDMESAFASDRCTIQSSSNSGSSGAGASSGTGGNSGVGGGGSGGSSSSVEQSVDDLLDDLVAGATQAIVNAVAGELCSVIDDNPNYASNTIFSTGGKAAFADVFRSTYDNSAIVRDYIETSGYWAAAGETAAPASVITQTGNSCMTNIGFVNAVCYATGPQYTTNGSYRASDAPNSGGCNEGKL